MRVFRIALAIIISVVISVFIVGGYTQIFDWTPWRIREYAGLLWIIGIVLSIAIFPGYSAENIQQTLSQKYSVLGLYKGLAYLMMIVNTGWTLYSLVQINDVSKEMEKYSAGGSMDNAMLTMIVTYVITMFSLFCLTKMIDFLFDLDLNKSNK